MSLYFYYIVTLIYLIVHIMYRIAFEINYSILFYSILICSALGIYLPIVNT